MTKGPINRIANQIIIKSTDAWGLKLQRIYRQSCAEITRVHSLKCLDFSLRYKIHDERASHKIYMEIQQANEMRCYQI